MRRCEPNPRQRPNCAPSRNFAKRSAGRHAIILLLAACAFAAYATDTHAEVSAAAASAPRTLVPDDYYRFLDVTEPQLSPDGTAVAYLVTAHDREADAERGDVWLVNWDGSESRALTHGESASHPRFSPDGRYVAFISTRPHDATAQIWVLDRRGGEARQLTHLTGEIAGYAWSPDGKQVVLVMNKVLEGPASKSPHPIVIDRYRFKRDEDGYLDANSTKHLYLVDVASGDATALTSGEFEDDYPAWSPDGKTLAYLSSHGADAERTGTSEIYLIEPHKGAVPRKLVSFYTPDSPRLTFSPDGASLAFLEGMEPKYFAYMQNRLAVVTIASGTVRRLGQSLDRPIASPQWSADGTAIDVIVSDAGHSYAERVTVATDKLEPLSGGTATPTHAQELSALDQSSAAGRTVLLATSNVSAPEIYALEAGALRPLSAHNKELQSELKLGNVQEMHFKSRDGTMIQGQIFTPPGYIAGRRYPTILWIHGGPSGGDQNELIAEGYSPSLERQLFAAQGYVVLAVNYRGSSDRGWDFQRSIFADWGHKEVEDLLAGVDHAIAQGFADPGRLGIGGWSYGGILTDYTVASDPRFKAGISGAGSGNQITMYGMDEYVLQYDNELKPPWETTPLWLKLSYPFFHANRIHTPVLFMGGDKDFNVPIAGGEQMYMALRKLGVPTELVIYPGEFHVFTRPSFIKDRAERYIAWFDKYLKQDPPRNP
jgi:dipeptidyl aminopeptidase/acylaminoacyl peptidase